MMWKENVRVVNSEFFQFVSWPQIINIFFKIAVKYTYMFWQFDVANKDL